MIDSTRVRISRIAIDIISNMQYVTFQIAHIKIFLKLKYSGIKYKMMPSI